jgi:hypothetical protein
MGSACLPYTAHGTFATQPNLQGMNACLNTWALVLSLLISRSRN